MTTIPDDIMAAASKLLDTLQWDIDSADADRERIARAILAERERADSRIEQLEAENARLEGALIRVQYKCLSPSRPDILEIIDEAIPHRAALPGKAGE